MSLFERCALPHAPPPPCFYVEPLATHGLHGLVTTECLFASPSTAGSLGCLVLPRPARNSPHTPPYPTPPSNPKTMAHSPNHSNTPPSSSLSSASVSSSFHVSSTSSSSLVRRHQLVALQHELAEVRQALVVAQHAFHGQMEHDAAEPLRAEVARRQREIERLRGKLDHLELRREAFRQEMIRGDDLINHMRALFPDIDERIPSEEEDTRFAYLEEIKRKTAQFKNFYDELQAEHDLVKAERDGALREIKKLQRSQAHLEQLLAETRRDLKRSTKALQRAQAELQRELDDVHTRVLAASGSLNAVKEDWRNALTAQHQLTQAIDKGLENVLTLLVSRHGGRAAITHVHRQLTTLLDVQARTLEIEQRATNVAQGLDSCSEVVDDAISHASALPQPPAAPRFTPVQQRTQPRYVVPPQPVAAPRATTTRRAARAAFRAAAATTATTPSHPVAATFHTTRVRPVVIPYSVPVLTTGVLERPLIRTSRELRTKYPLYQGLVHAQEVPPSQMATDAWAYKKGAEPVARKREQQQGQGRVLGVSLHKVKAGIRAAQLNDIEQKPFTLPEAKAMIQELHEAKWAEPNNMNRRVALAAVRIKKDYVLDQRPQAVLALLRHVAPF